MKDAKRFLQQELTQAKKGQAYYTQRIADLESALKSLSGEGLGKQAGKQVKKPAATASKVYNGLRSTSAKGNKGKRDADMPKTGQEFWLSLLSSEKKSTQQILDEAASQLKLNQPDQKKKLANRWHVGIGKLVADNKIAEVGKGRDRRFYLPA